MEKICFLLVFSIFTNCVCAQKSYTITNTAEQQKPLSVFAHFISQGIYGGLRVGVERPLKTTDYLDKNGQLRKTRERAVQYSVGFYHHGGFHTNLFFTTEYVFRKVKPSGFFTEFKTGVGLSRTFLGAETYSVTDGVVKQSKGAGDFYFMPNLSFGIGKDFSKTPQKRPISFHTNLNLAGLLPYNGLVLPTPMLEIGVKYRFSNTPQYAVKYLAKQRQK
jgi:hypothetical protein